MTDPKEFESLDELFRKTFDKLPDTPDPSGWDNPSGRVWQHVQAQIAPSGGGWSLQTVAIIAAFAVALTVGLYLLLSRGQEADMPATEVPVAVETPRLTPTEPAAEMPLAATSGQEEQVVQLSENNQVGKKSQMRALTRKKPRTADQEASASDHTDEKAAPSGKAPVSPNTMQRRKAELARKAAVAWKTPLTTLPLHWPELKTKDNSR